MRCKIISFLLLLVGFGSQTFGQNEKKYRVWFADKPETNFNPYTFFDAKALERRRNQGLPLYDETDLPVSPQYLNTVALHSQRMIAHSRWFNMAAVYATPTQARELAALPFVKQVEEVAPVRAFVAGTEAVQEEWTDERVLQRQTERMGAKELEAAGVNGKGIRIAVFDVGFSGADVHPAFEHLRKNGRILKTYDFVKKRESVYDGGWHGTAVLSCIGGRIREQWSGLAWDAEFLLARTEIGNREPFAEEEYWVAAAEWADQHGADLINSSLGYTKDRYFPEQMDGKTAFVSRGANMAARKGMLVVNAAGNEGSGDWEIIGAPADADSVLSVGGLEVCCDYHISFSSFGPTADLRMKPNVAAQGHTYSAKTTGTDEVDGTSFASPLMAGFAACMWQQHRELSNMQLFRELEKAGHLYPYFDYAHGFGLPHASRFMHTSEIVPTFQFDDRPAIGAIVVKLNEGLYTPGADVNDRLVYVSLLDARGKLLRYMVVQADGQEAYTLEKYNQPDAHRLRVHFKGYTAEYPLR
jgi:hypothetical protein